MQLILPSSYALLLGWCIFRFRIFRVEGVSSFLMAGIYLLKIAGAVGVWWIFTRIYPSTDLQEYFNDGNTLFYNLFHPAHPHALRIWDASFEGPLFNGSRIMILLNLLLVPFAWGNIYVHFVVFCFLSFLGMSALLRALVRHFPDKKNGLLLLVFFIPDVFFFSSGIFKESLAICWVGCIVGVSDFGLRKHYSTRQLLFLTTMMGLLVLLKIYIAVALIPVLFANFLLSLFRSTKTIFVYFLAFLIYVSALTGLALAAPNWNVLKLLSDRQAKSISEAKGGVFLVNEENFIWVNYHKQNEVLQLDPAGYYRIRPGSAYISWKLENMQDTSFVLVSKDTARYRILYSQVPANSVIHLKRMSPQPVDFLKAAPLAIVNTLFRPLIFEFHNWLSLFAGLENLWIAVFCVLPFIRFNRANWAKKEIILFLFFFSMLLFVQVGITTPVVGGMIRYRTVGLLFFVPMLYLLTNLSSLFSKKKMIILPATDVGITPVEPSPNEAT